MHIQFLRFTTGKPHDLALGWTFEVDLKCKSPSDCEIGMEVMGSRLVIIVTRKTRARLPGRHQKIYFADWTRGYSHCVRLSCSPLGRCSPRMTRTGSTSTRWDLLSHSYLCFEGLDSPCSQTRLCLGSLQYHGGKRQHLDYSPNSLRAQVTFHQSTHPSATPATQ
jgi:hypothetical protein